MNDNGDTGIAFNDDVTWSFEHLIDAED